MTLLVSMETSLVAAVRYGGRNPQGPQSFWVKIPITLFFMKFALLRSLSSASLRVCSPNAIVGSHPAHVALRGALGWESGPCHPGILPLLLGRDAAKRAFIPSREKIFAKVQVETLTTHLGPCFRTAVVFRAVPEPPRLNPLTPTTGKVTRESPLGSGESQARAEVCG